MFSITRDLLPIKAHILIFNAAQACYLSYLAVAGRQAGISPGNIGVILGVAPLAGILLKPLAGYIADRIRNVSAVIIVCELLLMLSCWGVFVSPRLSVEVFRPVLNTSFPTCPKTWPDSFNVSSDSECTLSCGTETRFVNITGGEPTNCSNSCAVDCLVSENELQLSGLVIFVISVTLTFSLSATLYSVTDAACYEALGPERAHLFGQQRLWGTLSWGLVSPVIGVVIDAVSTPPSVNYVPGVIVFTVLIAINIVLLLCIPRFMMPTTSDNFLRDLTKIYKDVRVIVFTFWALLGGILMGALWTYSVWMLEEVHASKTLTGLTFALQALLIEIPMFFISGRLLGWFGHFGCMALAFAGFGIKFVGYSFLQNAYYALLVDIVGGAVFPLFYVALTGFANLAAVPGTSSTMQCLLGATYEGIGCSIGSYLCGQLISLYGIRQAFRLLGVSAFVCAPICGLAVLLRNTRTFSVESSSSTSIKSSSVTY